MTRRLLTGMTVCMALAICVPAHAIVLRYAPKVGEVNKQKATFAGRMQTTMAGMGEGMRMEISGEVQSTERVLSQTDEVTRVQTDITSGSFTATMGEESRSEDIGTGKTVLDIDRQGTVVKVIEMDLPQAQQMMGTGAEGRSFDIPFPDDDVAINGTWSGTMAMPTGQDTPPIKLPYECTLLDLTTFQDRKCAKIRITLSGPFEMNVAQMPGVGADAQGSMNATMKGDFTCYYDYENSVYVYGEGTLGMDMNMSMGGTAAGAGDMTMKMLMNIKTALQK